MMGEMIVMKKLLFVHGGEKVKEDEEKNLYTDGSYSCEVWRRYKTIAPKISVVFRKEKNIYPKDEAQKKFQLLDKDIVFHEAIDKKTNIKSFFSIRNEIENRKLIKKLVKENDYVIARVPSGISYYAIKIANKYNKKLLVEVVGCPFDCMWNHSIRGKILAIPEYLRLKYYMKKTSKAIYVSENFLQKRYPNKGNKISCSDVVLNGCSEIDLKERIKKIKTYDRNHIYIIGTVGAVNTKYKGQQYVIKAIEKLIKKGYNLEYYIVGGGDNHYLKKLAQRLGIENRIKFMGPKPHQEVFDFMRKIDIYVQPSNAESHGRVIIEAMSVACPCIGSSTGGIPELIEDKYVFKRKKYKSLIEKIELMINEGLLESSKYSYEKAKEFTEEKLNEKRKEIYLMFRNGEK